jgi:hypothetical protein
MSWTCFGAGYNSVSCGGAFEALCLLERAPRGEGSFTVGRLMGASGGACSTLLCLADDANSNGTLLAAYPVYARWSASASKLERAGEGWRAWAGWPLMYTALLDPDWQGARTFDRDCSRGFVAVAAGRWLFQWDNWVLHNFKTREQCVQAYTASGEASGFGALSGHTIAGLKGMLGAGLNFVAPDRVARRQSRASWRRQRSPRPLCSPPPVPVPRASKIPRRSQWWQGVTLGVATASAAASGASAAASGPWHHLLRWPTAAAASGPAPVAPSCTAAPFYAEPEGGGAWGKSGGGCALVVAASAEVGQRELARLGGGSMTRPATFLDVESEAEVGRQSSRLPSDFKAQTRVCGGSLQLAS